MILVLQGIIGQGADAQGYSEEEFPDTFAQDTKDGIWKFCLRGGNDLLDVNINFDTPGAHGNNPVDMIVGEMIGIWLDRSKAIEVACLLRQNFPLLQDKYAGIYRAQLVAWPQIERGVIRIAADQDEGGERTAWKTTANFKVWVRRVAG